MSFLSSKLARLSSIGHEKLSQLSSAAQSLALTKWYVDTLFDDGTVLCFNIGELSLGSARLARVVVDLFSPDGQPISGSADAHHLDRRADGFASACASTEGESLRFRTDRLEGDLRITARYPSFVLRDPFLAQDGQQIRWQIEVPDADVTGTIRVQGTPRTVRGRGYRDRVELEFTPWGQPLRMIRWGRAVAGPHASTWVEATTAREVIACTWKDGTPTTQIPAGAADSLRPLVAGGVADRDNLSLGALLPVVRKLTRDPYQEKRAGKARLDGHEGWAVEDMIRFRG